MLTDGAGIPIAVAVAGANRHDIKLLGPTLEAIVVDRPEPSEEQRQSLSGDRGYDFNPHCRAPDMAQELTGQ